MTPSAIGTLLSVVVLVAGVAYFGRQTGGRTQLFGIAASVIAAVVIGWFSWLLGTSA